MFMKDKDLEKVGFGIALMFLLSWIWAYFIERSFRTAGYCKYAYWNSCVVWDRSCDF